LTTVATIGRSPRVDAPVTQVATTAYSIPTDAPESDGTFEWSETTIVIVEVEAAGQHGLGYTYTNRSAATLIRSMLADVVQGRSAMDVPGSWVAMCNAVRNVGRPGVASTAIAAVDAALWDLKARLLDFRSCRCSDRPTAASMSTAAAASRPTRSTRCGGSLHDGWMRASPA
jgi:hypothetical protein